MALEEKVQELIGVATRLIAWHDPEDEGQPLSIEDAGGSIEAAGAGEDVPAAPLVP